MDFTKTYHTTTYPRLKSGIASQHANGRTVLITGGATGIGFTTARSFAAIGGATRLIVVARRQAKLAEAKSLLEKEFESRTEIITESCDIGNPADVQKLWDGLRRDGVNVDVMVLSAVHSELLPHGFAGDKGLELVFKGYEINVFGNARMTERFLGQGGDGKVLLNVSSAAAHFNPVDKSQLGYASTKGAFTQLLQHVAHEVPVEKTFMLSYHPGAVLTEAAKQNGFEAFPIDWNDANLPADFAVWAASDEAKFLHGRMVWVNWDVDELISMKDKFQDPCFLKLGLQGPTPVNSGHFFAALMKESK